MKLHYITGNQSKFDNAREYLSELGINITQRKLNLQEIQSEDGSDIALTKARQAYNQIKEPVFVNDASWSIPALNGFPGPFMKYISKWLSNADILTLMSLKKDRTIYLIDVIAYKDTDHEKVFLVKTKGSILPIPEGDSNGPEVTKIISLSDDGKSLASVRSQGFTDQEKSSWSAFADWLRVNSNIMQ